jgi:hypothetical protein
MLEQMLGGFILLGGRKNDAEARLVASAHRASPRATSADAPAAV